MARSASRRYRAEFEIRAVDEFTDDEPSLKWHFKPVNSEPDLNDDAERPAGKFRPETLAEIGLITDVDWFPGGPLEGCFSALASPTPTNITGYEVSLVQSARALAVKARDGDEDAALRLFLMAATSQLELWLLMRSRPDLLRESAEHSISWPFPASPFSGIVDFFKSTIHWVNLGRLVLQLSKSTGRVDAMSSVCAFQLLAFMVVARRGLVGDERSAKWAKRCMDLPPLSGDTWEKHWWEMGKEIANDMYPDLHHRFYGKEADQAKKRLGDAIHQLKTPFKNLWGLFLGVERAPRAAAKKPRSDSSSREKKSQPVKEGS